MFKAFALYSSVFAGILLLAAIAAHGVMAKQYRSGQEVRLTIMVRDAEEAVESTRHGKPLAPALATVLEGPDEGIEWQDAQGRVVASVGRTGRSRAAIVQRRINEVGVNGTATAIVSDQRIDDSLRQLDIVLVIAVLLTTIMGATIVTAISARAIARVQRTLERVHHFTGDAAHELRTPLAAVTSNSDELVFGVSDEAGRARHLANIRDAAKQMKQLVEGLLILARADEGVGQDMHLVDVRACIVAVAASYAADAEGHGIDLIVRADSQVRVYGQPEQIERIVSNLVDNALRATGRGGRIEVAACTERHGAAIRVTDTGKGIAAPDLDRIFDRFWRGRDEDAGSGSGLGLAIARSLAQAHGGDITARSCLGKGSVFTVWIARRPPIKPILSTSS